MSEIHPAERSQPTSWSTRTLVAAGVAAVLLGLGAGAALGSAGGSGDGGPGGPGGRPGLQRGQLPPGPQAPAPQAPTLSRAQAG
jgi:hypothetical protein